MPFIFERGLRRHSGDRTIFTPTRLRTTLFLAVVAVAYGIAILMRLGEKVAGARYNPRQIHPTKRSNHEQVAGE
jgi:hypothetical protein